MKVRHLTVGQAVVEFLIAQQSERDGVTQPFFQGVFGIFGHGNVAGLGEALLAARDRVRFYLPRNEQAMVHTAAAFAKMRNRLQTFACTSSIGPGATNMLTAAAGATINRLPVLLLPGDIFATRRAAPVLQQLESSSSLDVSVNDCFKPVSTFWDRINRPEQLAPSLVEAMRVLTSPAETGAVTLALPQDVQADAWDFPEELFETRTWHVLRGRADAARLDEAAAWLKSSQRPFIIAGGGVIYSDACDALRRFVERTGIAVADTQAGKGVLPFDHPQSAGAVGVTGTPTANRLARDADVVLVIGSRLSDFTTASNTAFASPHVRFVSINVTELDAYKRRAMPLVGDARATLEELEPRTTGYRVSDDYARQLRAWKAEWEGETDRLFHSSGSRDVPTQAEVIGVLSETLNPRDVIVCAAGSLPGDLHKLWRIRDTKGYHLEYGYSCMGYEIAGGLGVKLAAPDRDVFVLVGDGSYLMMAQELVTAIQEGLKITVVLFDNRGFSSIGGLSESVGCEGFGTEYRCRTGSGELDGEYVDVDFVANAASLGAKAIKAADAESLRRAIADARASRETTVIVVPVDRNARVGGYESWWDVPVAETSTLESVRDARANYDTARRRQRHLL
ncbi:MAG: 3D-(3,5/4)-trihydroxycyclohexane-1,2-dione acylhydrolase (decyclizing) [Acidobacteria bacterium 13_1_40CM_4_65_8]|nr:MAG: 3D-(3,5/4)-trihydroxycyclohexane-1,2-dione acylhydrolase (decyclizing) [Acidobacteria bacterium 13_1_40CM_4_65_8]